MIWLQIFGALLVCVVPIFLLLAAARWYLAAWVPWSASRSLYCASAFAIIVGMLGWTSALFTLNALSGTTGDRLEWPVAFSGICADSPQRTRVVLNDSVSRVQIYDQQGNFQCGWQVPATGMLKIAGVTNQAVTIVTAREQRVLEYSFAGSLKADRPLIASESYAAFPELGVRQYVPTCVCLWPWSGGVASMTWFCLGIGLLGLANALAGPVRSELSQPDSD